MTARLLAAGVLCAATAAMLPAVASAAPGDPDPVVTTSDSTVTYVDPDLADATTTRVRGTLRAAVLDGPRPTYVYAIETGEGERVPVELGAELPAEAANGAITARLAESDGAGDPAVASAVVQTDVRPAVSASSDHRAYVVRAASTVSELTRLPAATAVQDRLQSGVLDEWTTEAEGTIGSFGVAGVLDLDTSLSRTDLCTFERSDVLWDEAQALLPPEAGTTADPVHLIVVFAGANGCGRLGDSMLGLGTVGEGVSDPSGGLSILRWDDDTIDHTGVHELGHNFGLGHANTPVQEYGDVFSVMGFGVSGGEPPALDSLYRDRLGLARPGEVATQTSGSATYDLAPRGSGSGLRSLQLTDPDTGKRFFVEYRSEVVRDLDAAYADGRSFGGLAFDDGVVISQQAPDYDSSGDLELVLPTTSGGSAALGAGQAYSRTGGHVRVAVDGLSTDNARVSVSMFTGTTPVVSGTPKVGSKLTATAGTYTPAAARLTYQWYSGSSAISGATGSTYTVTSGYRGKTLRVRVSAAVPGFSTLSKYSSSTAAVGYGTFSGATPKISGTVKVGRTLSVSRGTWTPSASTYRYQWYASSKAISGATRSTYKVPKSLAGKTLKVRVTGSRSGYVTLSKTSASTKKVAK